MPDTSESSERDYQDWVTASRHLSSSVRRTLALRIGESESSSWPTPNATVANDGETPETWLARREQLKEKWNNGNGCGTPLAMAVALWPTPGVPNGGRAMAEEDVEARGATDTGKRQVPLESVARLWSTPRASENENRQTRPTPSQVAGEHGMNLATEASLWQTPRAARGGQRGNDRKDEQLLQGQAELWATPRAEERQQRNSQAGHVDLSLQVQTIRPGPTSSPPPRGCRPQLGAWFAEFLMGLPPGWTELTDSGPVGMQQYLSSSRRLLSSLVGERD